MNETLRMNRRAKSSVARSAIIVAAVMGIWLALHQRVSRAPKIEVSAPAANEFGVSALRVRHGALVERGSDTSPRPAGTLARIGDSEPYRPLYEGKGVIAASNPVAGLALTWSSLGLEVRGEVPLAGGSVVGATVSTTAVSRGPVAALPLEFSAFSLGACTSAPSGEDGDECLHRVERRAGNVVEWYENVPEGIEQGWDIEKRPDGVGPVTIDIAFGANVDPRVAGLDAVLVRTRDGRALRYAEPHARDESGRDLPVQLAAVGSDKVRITVDDRGARYPIVVDPLITASAWATESNTQGALYGYSVAAVGDINGDGFGDVLVGAYRAPNGTLNNAGAAFMFFGGPSGLATSPAWTVRGTVANSFLGFAVAGAGDVNGDGFADVILGAYGETTSVAAAGRVYVFHGGPLGLASTPARSLPGTQASARFGWAVAGAGDINGDGYADVVVGAPYATQTLLNEGSASVFLGSASGVQDTAAWVAYGGEASALLGSAVATAGDVNGDGFADIAVGNPNHAGTYSFEGEVRIYSGGAGGLASNPSFKSTTLPLAGANRFAGAAVAPAGDVNADGFDDVLVGSPGFGAYLLLGSASGVGANVCTFTGTGMFGNAVDAIGDINGDGFADIAIGNRGANSDSGAVSVYLGGSSCPSNTPTYSLGGTAAGQAFGTSVSGGDVNGDGFADLLVGIPQFSNGETQEGSVRAYIGAPSYAASQSLVTVTGTQANAQFGFSVSATGDVNGDGIPDLVVGEPYFDGALVDEGRVSVFLGSGTGYGPQPTWTRLGGQANALFGYVISSARDATGDGVADLLIGAPNFTTTMAAAGKVYLFAGGQGGPSNAPLWVAEGDQASARFGSALSLDGDVNGDGFADILIGAPGQSVLGFQAAGVAHLFLGSASGPSVYPDSSFNFGQSQAQAGASVSIAGDVDGDGFDDVLVGAPGSNLGVTGGGSVWAFRGGRTPNIANPSVAIWRQDGTRPDSGFGFALAPARDVNRDGLADVAISERFDRFFVKTPNARYFYDHRNYCYARGGRQFVHRSVAELQKYYRDIIGGSSDFMYQMWDESRGYNRYFLVGSIGVGPSGYRFGDAEWEPLSQLPHIPQPPDRSWGYVRDDGKFFYGDPRPNSTATSGGACDGVTDVPVGTVVRKSDRFNGGVHILYGARESALVGRETIDDYATAFVGVGDVDGNGYADLALGRGKAFSGGYMLYSRTGSGLVKQQEIVGVVGELSGFAVSPAGDVNGDGFGDFVVAEPGASSGAGRIRLVFGNTGDRAVVAQRTGVRTTQLGSTTPLAFGGSTGTSPGFTVRADAPRGPMGGLRGKLEVEVKPSGQAFDGNNKIRGAQWGVRLAALAPLVLDVAGLSTGSYHWRARILFDPAKGPKWPSSRWFYGGDSGDPEGVHVRVGGGGATNASSCLTGSECASGFCSDGYCCDRACAGTCEACGLPGSEGTCTFRAAGTVCRSAVGECDAAETCSGASGSCPTDSLRPNGAACGDDQNPCTQDVCNGTSTVCQHPVGNAGVTCRAAAGPCDSAEVCTGASATCPSDAKAASGTTCRAANGVCDVAEVCDGSNDSCPADSRKPTGTLCRSAAGECDVTEFCDGQAADCPADTRAPAGMACSTDNNPCTVDACDGLSTSCQRTAGNAGATCRSPAGPCDVAETCTGTSTTCPADSKRPAGFLCGTPDGDCDLGGVCSGTGNACPAVAPRPAGTVCRPAVDVCDAAESCNGTALTCPADGMRSASTVCRASSGTCDVAETCTGTTAACPSDQLAPPTTVCRASAGACDVAEACTGGSAACPADAFASAQTECRASAGPCDVAEACSGSNAACPVDVFASATTVCRAATDVCDAEESCTGSGALCPSDAVRPSTTVCRASAGSCDVAETCNGSAKTCPSDGYKAASTVCRASAGACDVAETCSGSEAACPIDAFAPASQVCRASVGVCDVAETCTGTAATCPTDAFAPAQTECRAASGECDAAESCTGSSATCPADGVKPSSTVCRPAAGDCDVAEACTGSSKLCPTDTFKSLFTTCRVAAGDCDVAERCTGSSATCPVDAVKPSTTVCRTSAGACDVAESCDGVGVACPSDAFAPASQVCRASAGLCDVPESCTGTGASCPSDAFVSASTECRAAAGECDVAESCTGSSANCPVDRFAASTTVCRGAAGECDAPETCTGSAARCPIDAVLPSTATCRAAAGACDVAEKCTGASVNCPTDILVAANTVCRPAAGVCDVPETCDGLGIGCPTDAFAPATEVCRSAAGVCDSAEYCTGLTTSCPVDRVSSAGTVCQASTSTCTASATCDGTRTTCGSAQPIPGCCEVAGDCVARNCETVTCTANRCIYTADPTCDAGVPDAGTDGGTDGGVDASVDASVDGGLDAGLDGGDDASTVDAGVADATVPDAGADAGNETDSGSVRDDASSAADAGAVEDAAASPPAAPAAGDCGCAVVGAKAHGSRLAGVVCFLALAAIRRRRRGEESSAA
jgi:hypothetical protein